jgi:hypothetical protein
MAFGLRIYPCVLLMPSLPIFLNQSGYRDAHSRRYLLCDVVSMLAGECQTFWHWGLYARKCGRPRYNILSAIGLLNGRSFCRIQGWMMTRATNFAAIG